MELEKSVRHQEVIARAVRNYLRFKEKSDPDKKESHFLKICVSL